MATLDEISKEKQRVSEALARVDAQREKLASAASAQHEEAGCFPRSRYRGCGGALTWHPLPKPQRRSDTCRTDCTRREAMEATPDRPV
jgi:hypothetical protein